MKRKLILSLAAAFALLSPALWAETGSYDAKDGSRIVYDDFGSGERTLVFIHCWSCNRTYWKNQVPEFSKDYRLLLIDLPGHGDSCGGPNPPKTIPAMAKDVAELMAHLDVRNSILVGSSMGGPVSLEVARLERKRVLGIVGVDNLHNAEIPFPKEKIVEMSAKLEADYAKAAETFIPTMFAPKADPKIVAWTTHEAATSCEKRVCVPLIVSIADFDMKKAMKNAKVPIRNVNALPYSPQAIKTDVAVNRKYADFDAVELPDVGHFIMVEKPKAFNEALKKQIAAILEATKK